jgi:hypothetical protein
MMMQVEERNVDHSYSTTDLTCFLMFYLSDLETPAQRRPNFVLLRQAIAELRARADRNAVGERVLCAAEEYVQWNEHL